MRWFPILTLVAVGTMINYLDRTVLGIAAPFLARDLALNGAEMGLVFSAFSWSYALLQIPGGVFLDRFGTRITYSLSLTLWSVVDRVTRVQQEVERHLLELDAVTEDARQVLLEEEQVKRRSSAGVIRSRRAPVCWRNASTIWT